MLSYGESYDSIAKGRDAIVNLETAAAKGPRPWIHLRVISVM